MNNADGTVTLTWDAIEGAKGYKIYKIKDDLAISMDPTELVYTAAANETSVTIPEVNGPNDYIINTILGSGDELLPDIERIKHAITGLSWTPGTGTPVITIDPMEIYLNENNYLVITVNKDGLPVKYGTVDIGNYIIGQILDENGQARVNITPTSLGDIMVTAYDSNHTFLVSKNIKVIARNSSTIEPVTAIFDKEVSKQADIIITATLNGNSLINIINITSGGSVILTAGTDYIVNENIIIIKKEYLASQPVGITTLLFDFSGGEDPTIDISITDSTPVLISEVLTVTKVTTSGITVTLSPALDGLTVNDFILLDNKGQPVSITDVATDDNGATYQIKATLIEGMTYTITAVKEGYDFGEAKSVTVPAAEVRYTLTVINGTGSGTYKANTTAVVNAEVKEGMVFAGWKDEYGNIITYSPRYAFIITRSMVLTAVYSEVPITPLPTVTLDNNVIYDTSDPVYVTILVLGTFTTPQGYTVVDQGFISIKNPDSDPGSGLTLETSGITKISTLNNTNQAGQAYRQIITAYGNTFYVRGYLTYRDSTGNETTIYSDTVVKVVKNK